MVDRVRFGDLPGGGKGLRASTPGNDVNDMGLIGNQLAFDSRFLKTTKIHMVIEDDGALQGGVYENAITVPFGKTFADIPLVFSFHAQNYHPAYSGAYPQKDLVFHGGTLWAYDPQSTGGYIGPIRGLTTSAISFNRGNYAPQVHFIIDGD